MTDPDAVALLRAIVRHPDDDTPRLVYADWLQENGRNEEAEFLRVQCRLDSAEPDDPEYPALLDSDEELRLWLTAHVPGPRLTFPGGLSVDGGSHWWWYSQRGFPRFLHFSGSERPGTKAMRSLASALVKAFDTLPTRWLVIGSVTVAQLAALLKQPVLAGLSYLTLQHSVNEGEAEQAAQLLAKCRHLRNLRGLSLTFALGDDACQALASAPWEELEWFAPDCSQITPDGLRALAGASWFRRLRDLSLDGGLPDLTFEELTRLPTFPRLHTLDLSRNQFAEAGWLAFTNTRTFPKLTRLELEESDMGWHMISLLQATGFKLSVLNAPRCGVGLGAGAELAASPWAKSLRILNLSTNAIDPSDVKAITSCKRFTELRHLDLSYNGISPTGLSSLSANPALRELRSLNLAGRPSDNGGLASAHFDRFLSKLDMPELRHLDLSGRPLGPKAARKLADPKFASLTRLGLQGCKLTDPAVAALVASPALANLIQLGLNDNRLSTGLEKLTDRSVLPRLASCTLGGNSIPPALARKLRRRPGVRI